LQAWFNITLNDVVIRFGIGPGHRIIYRPVSETGPRFHSQL